MWKFESENFKEQILLNAVDKLVFSALLVVIATTLTTCQQRSDRSLMQAEKAIAIHVQRPMAIIEELSGPIRQLISVTKGAEGIGFTEQQAATVHSLALDIETLLDVLRAYADSQDVADAVVKIRDPIRAFSDNVSMKTVESEDYKDFSEELRERFVELSTTVLAHTTQQIQQDLSS